MNSVPSEDEFARAKQRMHERWRGIDIALSKIEDHFKDVRSLSRVEIVPGEESVTLYIFYKADRDIERNQNEGLTEEIASFCRQALGEAGRPGVSVGVVVDSHENVVRAFGGDYFLRLR